MREALESVRVRACVRLKEQERERERVFNAINAQGREREGVREGTAERESENMIMLIMVLLENVCA